MITGKLLTEMIVKSYETIDSKVDYLNEINVFPLPDGDTGLNIFVTMRTIVEELKKTEDNCDCTLNIKQASQAIAKGAFVGAKGNSGVILSQFFIGFAKYIENEERTTPQIFASALIEGSNRAYKAVMNPREGTILTVVRETADAAVEKARSGADWREIVEHCYSVAQKSTLDTPNLLEELKKARVVDAGALGFVYLIQGWLIVIASNSSGPRAFDLRKELENQKNQIDIAHTLDNIEHRFCTELVINSSNHDESELRDRLGDHGDSLIVIKDKDKMKIHIHTNYPQRFLAELIANGELLSIKIDDMKAQAILSHR